MSSVGGTNPRSGVYFSEVRVYPEAGFVTGDFGLSLTNSTRGALQIGSAPSSCAPPAGRAHSTFNASNCGAASEGWYVAVVAMNGTVVNVFGSHGRWIGPSVVLTMPELLYLVSGQNLTRVGNILSCYGTQESPVVGSVDL